MQRVRPAVRRRLAPVLAVALCLTAFAAVPASAQADPTTAPTTAPPALPAAEPSVDWLPIRRDAGGGEVKLGCTFRSQGSAFGYACGGHHDRWALDIIAGAGTPVYAVRAGVARDATGQGGGSGYGNVVRVDHGDGTETLYAHLSVVHVPAEGVLVDETSLIGEVGSTGSSSTNHLHYEKRIIGQSEPVDPGRLAACVLGTRVSYPDVRGQASWFGLPWGSFTLFSDGVDCDPDGTPRTSPSTARFLLPALALLR